MDVMKNKGFSLIEVLIYISIFSVAAVFLVAILMAVVKIQTRQSSANEINQQLTFVANTIRTLVQESSNVETTAGTATTTLTLRMASSSRDSTLVFSSGTALYLTEGTSSPVMLTDSNIRVDNFKVTKYENPGALALVQVDMSFTYNASSTATPITRSLRTGIARISAATFDSALLPNTNNQYDLGNTSYNWKDAYFAGSIGIGTTPPSTGAKLKTTGSIAFTTSSAAGTVGLILMSDNGSCFRVGINNSGAFTTSSVSCP